MATVDDYAHILGRLEAMARTFLREWMNDPENPDTYDAAAELGDYFGLDTMGEPWASVRDDDKETTEGSE